MRTDCYYFMTTGCARGPNCSFRHSLEAKNSPRICRNWQNGIECSDDCPDRHCDYGAKEKTERCYWETHGGCKKNDCPYIHMEKKMNYPDAAVQRPNQNAFLPEISEDGSRRKDKTMDDLQKELEELNNLLR